jgi:hypothetical protein
MAKHAKATLQTEPLEGVADRGYFNGEAGITVTLPKPMTSGAKAEGRFGKQDFCYIAAKEEQGDGLQRRRRRAPWQSGIPLSSGECPRRE